MAVCWQHRRAAAAAAEAAKVQNAADTFANHELSKKSRYALSGTLWLSDLACRQREHTDMDIAGS